MISCSPNFFNFCHKIRVDRPETWYHWTRPGGHSETRGNSNRGRLRPGGHSVTGQAPGDWQRGGERTQGPGMRGAREQWHAQRSGGPRCGLYAEAHTRCVRAAGHQRAPEDRCIEQGCYCFSWLELPCFPALAARSRHRLTWRCETSSFETIPRSIRPPAERLQSRFHLRAHVMRSRVAPLDVH